MLPAIDALLIAWFGDDAEFTGKGFIAARKLDKISSVFRVHVLYYTRCQEIHNYFCKYLDFITILRI